ncbi:histidine phosphatase family protein [Pseudoxanthomonas sp. LH2527]|uniref:SixA phosphatase family protein n=1 Tax=Pseudoxanthomonas sp. LH2527 TaxID=2923249 RepID=UPI001F1485B6|nr:phosphoglycerate mutase family protein [Pseudoxanthomonas sp. LH2527]MCH6484153.1 histidine phosphatase family protein [Pseudoxanthomonas sp. LH2527]
MRLPSRFRVPVLAVLALLVAACGTTPSRDASTPLTFVVVRHAEKATDDPENPSLSAAGQARAAMLAERLRDAPLVAAYATEFRRTQQTAQPVADAHRLQLTAYYARGPAGEIAAQWKQAHRSGTVLVVGHSNTVPALVAALCGCATDAMDETEYDRFSIVRFDADGRATLEVQRYGAPAGP